MKDLREKKPVSTIPDGCYECGVIRHDEVPDKEEHLKEISTDAQGNGYPVLNRHKGDS